MTISRRQYCKEWTQKINMFAMECKYFIRDHDNGILQEHIKKCIKDNSRALEFYRMSVFMGGSEELKRKTAIQAEKPKIELEDILKFIREVEKKREDKEINEFVYILLCHYGKIYVGYTHKCSDTAHTQREIVSERIEQHRNISNNCMPANFVHIFYPISLICSFRGNKRDEDLMTILFANCVGSNNVRGGKFSSPFIKYKELENNNIEDIKDSIMNNF